MNAVPSIALHLCQPLGKVSECEGRPNIVDEDDGVCTAVVALSDSPKPLLTCSVPDLELREGERERGGEVSLGEVLPKGNNLHVQQQVLIHTLTQACFAGGYEMWPRVRKPNGVICTHSR